MDVSNTANNKDPENIKYAEDSCKDEDKSYIECNDVTQLLEDATGTSTLKSHWRNLKNFVLSLTIEPMVFCYIGAFIMNVFPLSNLYIDKGCRNYFNFSIEICSNLSAYETEKTQVEILSNNYSLYGNLFGIIGAIAMVFIAPWSQKYGRRLPLMVAICGSILSGTWLIICSIYFESPMYLLVLARIFTDCTGGIICVFTIVYCHASEVTSEDKRLMKYTTVDIALGLGSSMGLLAAGMIYEYFGYMYVFITGTVILYISLLWAIFFVQETTGIGVKATWQKKMKDFFKVENIVSGAKSTFRARPGRQRLLMLLYMISISTIVIMYECYASISFIYLHHIYNWTQVIFSQVYTGFSIFQLFIMLVLAALFVNILKMSNFVLGIMGTISLMVKNILTAFAHAHVAVYFIAQVTGFLTNFASLAFRAEISKIAGKDEFGPIFSFMATCESIVPICGNIIVTKIFNATINIVPSVSYLLAASMMVIPLFSLMLGAISSRTESKIQASDI